MRHNAPILFWRRDLAITMRIPALWRPVVGANHVELEADNLSAALHALVGQFPLLGDQLFDERGEVREAINLFVNDEHVRYRGGLSAPLRDGDEVYIVPMISGGSR